MLIILLFIYKKCYLGKTFEEALLGINKVIGKKKQFKSRSRDRSSSSDRESSPIPEVSLLLIPIFNLF